MTGHFIVHGRSNGGLGNTSIILPPPKVSNLGVAGQYLLQSHGNLLDPVTDVELLEELSNRRLAGFNEAEKAVLVAIEVAAANPQRVVGIVERNSPTPILGVRLTAGETTSGQLSAKVVGESLAPATRVDLLVLTRKRRKRG